jgi:hypothetical protein
MASGTSNLMPTTAPVVEAAVSTCTLLLVAVVGVATGRDVATTAALYVWARLSGPLDVTLLSRAAMPATAETRFVRSAG